MIDDDPNIASLIELVLLVEGFDVTIAAGGEDGMVEALRNPPDVIILDVMMPKVDGWQIAEKLGKHDTLSDVPIIFCTALSDDDSMWKGWQFGAASYITKPFEPEHLLAEVVRVTTGDADDPQS